MLPFLRPELAALKAYKPHPPSPHPVDILDTNESPLDLPDELKAKLAAEYQQAIAVNRYPDGSHQALKQALVTYVGEALADDDAVLTPDHLSVGNGSDELIRLLLIATCLGTGQGILTATPTFSMYGLLAQTLGIPVVTVARRESDFSVDLGAAQQAIDQGTIRVVFMVHPNSPTGNALTAAERQWLRTLPESVLVVVDEAYFEFCQHTTLADALTRPNWVILRTFSKAFRLAAHRVGYAIAHPGMVEALEKVRLPYNLPSFSQAAAQVALANRQGLLDAIVTLLTERERIQSDWQDFPALRLWPSKANFIYARLTDQDRFGPDLAAADWAAGHRALHQRLLPLGTLIRHTGGGLRFTVGTPEENQRTYRNLAKIFAS
ncbi:MAG: histidinol-phosphate transaminase [Cyanobacteria bacterium P01_A01_bin.105]